MRKFSQENSIKTQKSYKAARY